MSISRIEDVSLDFCRFNVILRFSAYDVLTSEELIIDRIIIDGRDFTRNYKEIVDGRYVYEVSGNTTKTCLIELYKDTFFPIRSKRILDIKEFDEVTTIDLGRIGMLNEIKEDAFALAWRRTSS